MLVLNRTLDTAVVVLTPDGFQVRVVVVQVLNAHGQIDLRLGFEAEGCTVKREELLQNRVYSDVTE